MQPQTIVVYDGATYAWVQLISSGMFVPIGVWFLAFVAIMAGMQKYSRKWVNNITIAVAAGVACIPAWLSIVLLGLPFTN